MGTIIANTALTSATSQTDSSSHPLMTAEQFEREKRYQASLNFFRGLLNRGTISAKQYGTIEENCSRNIAHY